MIEGKYPDIYRVISETCEFFEIKAPVPESLPSQWLEDFKKRQLMVAIAKNTIIVIRPLFDEIEIGLSHDDFSQKWKWESQMRDLNIKGLNFSTSPMVFQGDRIFNLNEPEARVEEKAEPAPTAGPSGSRKIRKCPGCRHNLTDEELENGTCGECGQDFWICPRCDALIDEDPDEAESCPSCKKTYHKADCSKCGEEIWIDEAKCTKCGQEFKFSKCPSCKEKFIVSDQFDDCPFCQADLYICPRCGEYIDEDPDDDADFCPICKKSFHTVDCPKCGRDVFSDAEKCDHCGKVLKLGKCPYEDCNQPLVILPDMGQCPYCDNDLRYVKCPGCQEEFYLEEN